MINNISKVTSVVAFGSVSVGSLYWEPDELRLAHVGKRGELDQGVQRHLDVRDLSGRLLEEEPKKAPQCRLVRNDHVVVGPVELRKEGCEASTNVEIGFPSRIPGVQFNKENLS